MIRILVVGLGPIGVSIARAIASEGGMELAGLVDADPHKRGRTLAELTGQTGVAEPEPSSASLVERRVASTIDEAVHEAGSPIDAAVLATTSRFADLLPLVDQCLGHRIAVISTCEELLWPWYRHEAAARELDGRAASAGVAVLGTGVNPGFVMDVLPVAVGSMLRRVTAVRCVRRVDAALRRGPLQKKIGATLGVEAFADLKRRDAIGHRGLAESLALLAAGMGRRVQPGAVDETLEPVLAEQPQPSALGVIKPGQVAGIHQVARWSGDGLTVELDLTMAVGAADPVDKVKLEGPVSLTLKIPGGVPGDSATVAALLNNLPALVRASPGLRTMLDVPVAGCHNLEAR